MIRRAELKEIFELVDSDKSGAIDINELMEVFKKLGSNPEVGELREMLSQVHIPEVAKEVTHAVHAGG